MVSRKTGRFIMDEQELRELVAAVKAGRVSRRAFVRNMVGFGLTAPLANQILVHAGLAQVPSASDYKPTKAGGAVRPNPTMFRTKRSEEHTSELQSHLNLVCRLLLE